MHLHYQAYPPSDTERWPTHVSPILIIPGLFGSTINWRSIARQMGDNHPVIVVDQRNHGLSPKQKTNSYSDLVQDLIEFCDHHQIKKVQLCGHSMGGKVAMLFAHAYPERVTKLAVLDIAPVAYSHNHASHIRALQQLNLAALKSRSQADRELAESISDTATRMFLLQSLTGSVGAYQWKLNLPVLLEYMDELSSFPKLSGVCTVPTLFLEGEKSDYLEQKHYSEIETLFSNVRIERINDAGHWLHAEQSAAVLLVLNTFFTNDKKQ